MIVERRAAGRKNTLPLSFAGRADAPVGHAVYAISGIRSMQTIKIGRIRGFSTLP